MNGGTICIPLELLISFKLFLGTEKDIEDARYLHAVFKNNLDQTLLNEFIRKLNINKDILRYLK